MEFTTNEDDQRKAAQLKARLAEASDETGIKKDGPRVPNVTIAEGRHKYVLMSACLPGGTERQNFVVSREFAAYHKDAAEPMVEKLESSGYSSIRILGGGRLFLDSNNETIAIYGYSYGFGLADHALSKAVIQRDSRYENFDISWSNEGY